MDETSPNFGRVEITESKEGTITREQLRTQVRLVVPVLTAGLQKPVALILAPAPKGYPGPAAVVPIPEPTPNRVAHTFMNLGSDPVTNASEVIAYGDDLNSGLMLEGTTYKVIDF